MNPMRSLSGLLALIWLATAGAATTQNANITQPIAELERLLV